MVKVIFSYILIFITIFLSSVCVTFTYLKANVKELETSKFRLLQHKRIMNRLLINYNIISSSQNLLTRELLLKKSNIINDLTITDSLIKELNLNQIRLDKYNSFIFENKRKLAKALK